MEFILRFSGTIVELTVADIGTVITSGISDYKGRIDEELIENLEDVLYEMKKHNEEIQ
jgi:uncharacterized protein YeeX (DUF496 family)